MNWLHKIIDDCLAKMSQKEIFMMTPAIVPEEMKDFTIGGLSYWNGWKPMDSIITNLDIKNFEHIIGVSLPNSYKEFLKYKHFFNLRINNNDVQFPSFLPDRELTFLKRNIYEMLDPEIIIGRGYIYFADFQDYGILCFDSNQKKEDNEYPIIFIDHEELEEIHPYSENFRELMESNGEAADEFIDYLNEL